MDDKFCEWGWCLSIFTQTVEEWNTFQSACFDWYHIINSHKTYLMSTAEEWSPKDRSDIGKLTKLMHIQKKKGGEGNLNIFNAKKETKTK